MKKISIFLLTLIVLSGCGASKKTTICKGTLEYGQTVEDTIESKGDKVTKVITKYTYIVDESLKSEFIKDCETIAAEHDGKVGMKYEYKDNGDSIEEVYTVVYSEADFNVLKEMGYLSEDFDVDNDYVSLSKTIAGFEEEGSTCK